MRTQRGYSLMELMIVVSVLAVISGISLIIIEPALRAQSVETAARSVSREMGRARQISVDARRLTRVTFTTPRTITLDWQAPVSEGGAWTQVSQIDLSDEMEFGVDAGVFSGPEGFGTEEAINFSGSPEVFFLPDGSAIAGSGLLSNGVVYVSRPHEVDTTRAITLFGATGRIKQWEYVYTDGSWQ